MDGYQILCAEMPQRRDRFDKFSSKEHHLGQRYGQKHVFSPFLTSKLEISIIIT